MFFSPYAASTDLEQGTKPALSARNGGTGGCWLVLTVLAIAWATTVEAGDPLPSASAPPLTQNEVRHAGSTLLSPHPNWRYRLEPHLPRWTSRFLNQPALNWKWLRFAAPQNTDLRSTTSASPAQAHSTTPVQGLASADHQHQAPTIPSKTPNPAPLLPSDKSAALTSESISTEPTLLTTQSLTFPPPSAIDPELTQSDTTEESPSASPLESVDNGETIQRNAFPFTFEQVNGAPSLIANESSGNIILPGRTIDTNELSDHSGLFQVDFVATFQPFPEFNLIDATSLDELSIYVASSPADFFAGIVSLLIRVDFSDIFDSNGGPLQTYVVPQGNQFLPSANLGKDNSQYDNIAMSFVLHESDSQTLRNWLVANKNLSPVIGVLAGANVDQGFLSIATSTADLGNELLAFGSIIPTLSLALNISAIANNNPIEVTLDLPISGTINGNQITVQLQTVNDSISVALQRSNNLKDWVHCDDFPGDGQIHEYSESLHPSGRMFSVVSKSCRSQTNPTPPSSGTCVSAFTC